MLSFKSLLSQIYAEYMNSDSIAGITYPAGSTDRLPLPGSAPADEVCCPRRPRRPRRPQAHSQRVQHPRRSPRTPAPVGYTQIQPRQQL